MRIGEFAKSFDVSQSMVRYYINYGLLIPDAKNKQYLFGKNCMADMEQIQRFKKMRFSLNDIHAILSIQRLALNMPPKDRLLYRQLFENQLRSLKGELAKIDDQLMHLEQLMTSLEDPKTQNS